MAEVWLAEDLRLGRWVAVKVLRGTDDSDQFGSALEREARVVARLSHPGIVSVYDAGRVAGRPYLVMEYVHGLSVRELMAERGRFSEVEAVRYGQQIAAALQYAHEQGVIHCDVKPENILVTEQGAAKAVDFGIADTLTRTLSTSEARSILGTIAYLAPEVIQGRPPDARSDVYALAMTLYEMVAGRLPFSGASPAAAAGQRLASVAPPLRGFASEASPELERVLARGLAPVPEERFASAAEFANALRRVASIARPGGAVAPPVIGGPASPVRVAPVASAGLPPRRHPTSRLTVPPTRAGGGSGALWGIAIVLALIVGGGVAAAAIVMSSRGGGDEPVPTPTVQPSPTRPPATATRTSAPSATPTASPSLTATATATATVTLTPTRTPTPVPTQPGTATPTRTPTPTVTPTPPAATATPTPTPTRTPLP